MQSETIFRGLTVVLSLALFAIWVFFQHRAGAYAKGMRDHGRMQRQHEVKVLLLCALGSVFRGTLALRRGFWSPKDDREAICRFFAAQGVPAPLCRMLYGA